MNKVMAVSDHPGWAAKPAKKPRFHENEKLDIWARNEATDLYVTDGSDKLTTKAFSRGGGFSGTSINATYVVKRLTAEFGPVGKGWGVEIDAEDLLPGAPLVVQDGKVVASELIHRLRILFWWLDPVSGERNSFPQYGLTTFVGKNKNGPFTDEEAPKKSLTDAMTKAASWLGIGGDVHLGLWDDNKYAANRKAEEESEREALKRKADLALPFAYVAGNGVITHSRNANTWKAEWTKRITMLVEKGDKAALRDRWRDNAEAVEASRRADEAAVADIEKMVAVALQDEAEAIDQGEPPVAGQTVEAAPPAPPPGSMREVAAQMTGRNPAPSPGDETFNFIGPSGMDMEVKANAKTGAPAIVVLKSYWMRALDIVENEQQLATLRQKNFDYLTKARAAHPGVVSDIEEAVTARQDAFRKPPVKDDDTFPGDRP